MAVLRASNRFTFGADTAIIGSWRDASTGAAQGRFAEYPMYRDKGVGSLLTVIDAGKTGRRGP